MGQRTTIIRTIQESIEELSYNDVALKTSLSHFDPMLQRTQLPKFAVLPGPESIRIGIHGTSKDRTLRIFIQGFSLAPYDDLFTNSEDLIELIVNHLTSVTKRDEFMNINFSIIEINANTDQFEGGKSTNMAMGLVVIDIHLTLQFLEPEF